MSSRWILGLFVGLAALVLAPSVGNAATTLDSVFVVPNPYNVSGRTFGPKESQGYERIRFVNIPAPADECTIWIYTSAGNLVEKLTKTNPNADWQSNALHWNGRNSDNQYVVSDVYIFVVRHPTLGSKIGKFIVIR